MTRAQAAKLTVDARRHHLTTRLRRLADHATYTADQLAYDVAADPNWRNTLGLRVASVDEAAALHQAAAAALTDADGTA